MCHSAAPASSHHGRLQLLKILQVRDHPLECATGLGGFKVQGRTLTRANDLLDDAAALQEALEREGWDGGWYLRGFFDDGTPLGAARNRPRAPGASSRPMVRPASARREVRRVESSA